MPRKRGEVKLEYSISDIEREFLDFLGYEGIYLASGETLKIDGRKHRCTISGDKPRSKNGEYRIFADEWPRGWLHNWKTDGSPAYLNDSVTVCIDTKHHVLLVDGFDEKQYYLPSLGAMFKEGNYHLQELTFYQDCLNRNVKQRVRSYYRQPHKRGF